MRYTAWYRKVTGWHKIKNVIGDWTADEFKMIETDEDIVYQFPKTAFCFRYSAERKRSIEKRMSQEAGQTVQVHRR